MALYHPIPNYDNEPNHDDKHARFMQVLKAHSENQTHPIPEWRLHSFREVEEKKCICSHDILNNYFISNDRTKTTLIIGSDCMKRFLDPSLRCSECKQPIQNVVNRIEKSDFICRNCKNQRRKTVKHLRNCIFLHPGPYNEKKFSEVIEDVAYVETLLNIPDNEKTMTITLFCRYAKAVYLIDETSNVQPAETP